MKSIKRLFAMGLAVMMALSIPFSVSAAELEDAPIDESRTGSLTIYKYDLTNAEKDGVWDSSYVSTGVFGAMVSMFRHQRRHARQLSFAPLPGAFEPGPGIVLPQPRPLHSGQAP